MRNEMVLTLTGPDRVGIVEEVTRVLARAGGNVSTSRMARLGGEFAIIMLVSLPAEGAAQAAFGDLEAEGYSVVLRPVKATTEPDHAGWPAYRIEVCGADHEGIVHEMAAGLSALGISIESIETSTVSAPQSGTPLFTMLAHVVVPPALDESEWTGAVREAGNRSNVDVIVVPSGE